ncbi:MAG: restriction endonuclease subunit S [Lysobacter sp.]
MGVKQARTVSVDRSTDAGNEVQSGYKHTEAGLIPEDWLSLSLGEISRPVRGGSPRPAGDPRYFNGNFIPWLTVAALTNIPLSQMVVVETATSLTEEGSFHSRTLDIGTLIIANSGATLGVAKILGIKCCANDGIAALLDLDRDVSVRYLVHFINTKIRHLRDVVATGNGQPNLNTNLIRDISTALPSTRVEQEAIAEALSDADALIESLQHLIAKKRQIKQGAMQSLLTGQKRLPGFTAEWEEKRLGDLGVFLKGRGVTKDQATSGALPCVRYGEIYTRHENVIQGFFSWISEEVAKTATPLKHGDLIFAGSGETKAEIGKCIAFVGVDAAFAGGDTVILRAERVDPAFMGYYLNTSQISTQKASKGQGDAVVHISATALASVDIRIPELAEQTAIAMVISSMDTEIAALETRLSKAREIKQGMMQALLTGAIRLPLAEAA